MARRFFSAGVTGGNAAAVQRRQQTAGEPSGSGVQRGPMAARWVCASDEISVSVRAPHEVRQVTYTPNPQSTTFGSLTDTENSAMMLPNQPLSMSVAAQWRARHNRDDIRPAFENLERLGRKDARLGRHPLVLLRWSHLAVEGWVSQLHFEWLDGTFDSPPFLPQAFVVRLTVTKAQPRVLDTARRFERFTKYRRIGQGETLDSIAFREYGDPDIGNTLRRNNPGIGLGGEVPGDVVRIFDRDSSIIRDHDPNPQSPALGGNVRELLQTLAEERLSLRGPGLDQLEADLGLA